MSAYVITKAIWDAVQKTAVTNHQVSGLLSDASYVVVDCDAGSEFRTLAAAVAPTIKITRAPSIDGLGGLVAGMTATEVLTEWTGHPLATVSDGSDPHYAHAVLIKGGQVTDLIATADLTISTTISAAGAQDVVVATQALSVADKVVDPVIPTDPVSPPDPIVPTDPVVSPDPVVPTDPVTPTDPVSPLDPVTPTDPVSPPDPIVPTDPVVSPDPVVPTDPVSPRDPVTPTDPVVPTDPISPPDPAKTVVPNVGPYTLTQVEALRTDGTTRGVTIGRTLKKVGVDTLPAGMTRSGTRITVASGADIALVENWDFTGHDFVIKGRVRLFSNCKFGFPTDLQLCLIDMYAGSRIDAFKRCSFLGAGYYGSYTKQSCIRPRIGNPILTSPIIDLMERCEFFGWGGDVIKCVRGGVIRLCYFDTAINLPAGIAKWSSTKAYRIGDWVLSADGKYAYSAATAGTNLALPIAKNSNANWQNQDPHSDTINPYFQFDPSLKIEACYINRLEATRAVDPGNRRVVGINNGIRATRDVDSGPMNEVQIINTIISKSELNESCPLQLQDLTEADTMPAIISNSWIGTQKGGEAIHPTGRTGHTIVNLSDYLNPTTPSANHGEIGTPAPGTDTGGETPPPPPPPTYVIDLSKAAIVGTWAQSEPALALDMSTAHSGLNTSPSRSYAPDLDAPNFHFIGYDGEDQEVEVLHNVKMTQENRKQAPDSIINLANALNYAVPGKYFVLAAANERGSSRVETYSDSYGARKWGPIQQVIDAVIADYPQGFDRWCEYWYSADSGLIQDFTKEFAPLYFKQTEAGAPFAFGAVVPGVRNAVLDHSLFDFNSGSTTAKGQGAIKHVPLDLIRERTGFNFAKEKRDGLAAFAEDPRFKALGGVMAHPAVGWTGGAKGTGFDWGHPSQQEYYGWYQAVFEFYMPSLLRAAGIPITACYFSGVFTAPDGSYAEVNFHAPNGGTLSTSAKARRETPIVDDLWYQDVYGFEIQRASGGGRSYIAKVGASGIATKHQGTVTIVNGKAHIVMLEPLVDGDEISYMTGKSALTAGYAYREPQRFEGLHRNFAVEYIEAFTDPDAVFPFDGIHADHYSAVWPVVRGGLVGTASPGTASLGTSAPAAPAPGPEPEPATGDYWTTGIKGPTLQSAGLPSRITKVHSITEMFIPTSVTASGVASRFHIVGGLTLEFSFYFSSTGTVSLYIEQARNSNNTSIKPSDSKLFSVPKGQRLIVETITDFTALTLVGKMTGEPDSTRTLGGGGDGTFRAGFPLMFNGASGSTDIRFPEGVQIYSHDVYLNDSTTPYLAVPRTAAEVNASPLKISGSGNAT